MRYYRAPINTDTSGIIGKLLIFTSSDAMYIATDGSGRDEWVEISKEEYVEAGGIVLEQETVEEKLARLESVNEELKQQNLILMDALATTFEEILALRAIVEGGSS